MATYTVKIDTGNAAFDGIGLDSELSRMLRKLADRIESEGVADATKLYDVNGNNVGEARFK